jgi:hypothetical protein
MWSHKVNVKQYFTEKEDHASIQASMESIANALKDDLWFSEFRFESFYSIPKGDDTFGPVDYANRLLNRLYDFADSNRIWIG